MNIDNIPKHLVWLQLSFVLWWPYAGDWGEGDGPDVWESKYKWASGFGCQF